MCSHMKLRVKHIYFPGEKHVFLRAERAGEKTLFS